MSYVKYALVAAGLLIVTTAVAGRGDKKSIRGVVELSGAAPSRPVIDMKSEPHCAKGKLRDETVVSAAGKLRDVHVRIKAGTAGKHRTPIAPLVIKQDTCMYRPRVAGAVSGQKVWVLNDDPTMHNVHAYKNKRTLFNRVQMAGSRAIEEDDIGNPGDLFRLKCDVHPWMAAFVPITDHPFFDVTDKGGAFEIKGVPAGDYTLEAWHPKYGLKSQKVRAGATNVKFSFP